MRRWWFGLAFLSLGFTALPGNATEYRQGDQVVISAGEVINDDLVVAAQSLQVEGTIQGDLIAAARTIRVPGRIQGNLLALGQTVEVPGDVTGSVRAAGQTVAVAGTVGRSMDVAGQTISLDSGARIGRDLDAAGQTLGVDGSVGGRAALASTTARIGGTIARNVRFEGERLAVGPTARLQGGLTTRAQRPVVIAPAAVITGPIRRLPAPPRHAPAAPKPLAGLAGNLFFALALFVTGAVGLALVPRFLGAAADALHNQPGWSILWGLILLIVVPIAAALAFMTLIGIPLGLLAITLWGLAILFSAIPVALFLGRQISVAIRHGVPLSPYANLAIGLIVLAFLGAIPFLGGFVRLAVVLFGIGMFTLAALPRATRAQAAPA